jgi:hypothetical protein
MTHASATFALKFASAALLGFGLLNLAALFTPATRLMDLFVDLVFLPVDGAQSVTTDAARLWIGISGGLLAGWGVTMWQLTSRVYASDHATGRAIMLPGIITWFVVDGMGSALAGAPFNAVVNVVFLVMFALPLLIAKADTPAAANA